MTAKKCTKKRDARAKLMFYCFSKIQLVIYHQCCVLIGLATTRLYVIAY